MKLTHPLINVHIILDDEEKVSILVVENQHFFTELLIDLHNQINKISGKFVLSEDNKPIDIYKNVEVLSEFISFEINKRTLLNKLLQKADLIAQNEENYMITRQLYSEISQYAALIANNTSFDIDYLYEYEVSSILKAINFRFKEDYSSISEKVIDYMLLVREFVSDKCFVLVNFRSYISDEEINEFYKTILLNKLKVIIISGYNHQNSPYEKKTIIDKGLCEF